MRGYLCWYKNRYIHLHLHTYLSNKIYIYIYIYTHVADNMKKRHRSYVIRAAYLAEDDPSIAQASNTLWRRMTVPTAADNQLPKRLGRFLIRETANVFAKKAAHDRACTSTQTPRGLCSDEGQHHGSGNDLGTPLRDTSNQHSIYDRAQPWGIEVVRSCERSGARAWIDEQLAGLEHGSKVGSVLRQQCGWRSRWAHNRRPSQPNQSRHKPNRENTLIKIGTNSPRLTWFP